jgi:hypothetical protein
MVINEEIVGGLKNAIEHGNSLKSAMMSFFNAGYDRKEIEEAAATLLDYPIIKPEFKTPEPETKKVESIPIPKTIQKVSQYGEEPKEIVKPKKGFLFFKPKKSKELKKVPEKISEVTKFVPKEIINAMPQTTPKKIGQPVGVSSSSAMTPQEKAIVVILIGLLVFLVGILIVIFLFRQQLIDFISSMVS